MRHVSALPFALIPSIADTLSSASAVVTITGGSFAAPLQPIALSSLSGSGSEGAWQNSHSAPYVASSQVHVIGSVVVTPTTLTLTANATATFSLVLNQQASAAVRQLQCDP